MRIGVNVFPLRNATGGARYVFAGLLPAMLRLDREQQYLFFSHPAAAEFVREILGSDQPRLNYPRH